MIVNLAILIWPRFELLHRDGLAKGFLLAYISVSSLKSCGGGAKFIEVKGVQVRVCYTPKSNGRDPEAGVSVLVAKHRLGVSVRLNPLHCLEVCRGDEELGIRPL